MTTALRYAKIGVYGGRIWHLYDREATAFIRRSEGGLLHRKTLCGKAGDEEWRPGWQNTHARTCSTCTAAIPTEEQGS